MSSARPSHDRAATALLALLLATGLMFDGLNTMFGNPLVCLAACLFLALLVLTAPPPVRFWRGAIRVLFLLAAAGGWAALGPMAQGRFAVDGRPVAPDLGDTALIGFVGNVAVLLCAAVLGWWRVALAGFVDWLLVFGCAGIVLALVGDGGEFWTGGDDGRFWGTLGNANAAAAAYGGFAALALARVLEVGDRLWHDNGPMRDRLHAAALWVALLLAAGACVLTASRMGVLLMLVALAVVAARAASRRHWRGRALALGIALPIVALFASSALLVERFGQLPEGARVRLLLWRHNATLASARPISGYGIGGFPSVNARYLGDVRTAQAIWMTNSPHDIALRLLLDAGLPYVALLSLAAVLLIARIIDSALARGLDLVETGLAMAAFAILGSALVDIALEVPAVAALMLVFVGLLWGRALARRDQVVVDAPIRQPRGRETRIGGRRARGVEHRRAAGRR